MRKVFSIVLTGLAVLGGQLVFGAGPVAAAECEIQYVDGLGPACRLANGYFEVFAPDGRSLGYTHGLDPVPSGPEPSPEAGPRPVSCLPKPIPTDRKAGYGIQVLYARAFDDVDNFAPTLGPLRTLVENANGILNEAATPFSATADLRVNCLAGQIRVLNVVLPTPMAAASYSTIADDLADLGFTDIRYKYWVFYDDTGACSCGGTANIWFDDRPTPANLNNGFAPEPGVAVNFGYINSARIMLHELGHNLGAVQNSAPHTTGANHCIDGLDIMCYNDGGPSGHLYSTSWCSVEVFDCGHDDYFHLCPSSESINHYLMTHWNVGSSYNNFIQFDRERAPPLTC